jgi:nucleoside 2-deoxyribosyltransferase
VREDGCPGKPGQRDQTKDKEICVMEKQHLYIAGPECFYPDGDARLMAFRKEAEAAGYAVSLPNDNPLDLTHEDLRKNADAIFENCAVSMNETTAILCDLECFRGPLPDGGSIYELGMAYGRGLPCYGYTRDKRPLSWKFRPDGSSCPLEFRDLPFSPNVVGSTKIVEGGFSECLKLFSVDLEERAKMEGSRHEQSAPAPASTLEKQDDRPVVFLAGPERWLPEAERDAVYAEMKRLCAEAGLLAITPADPVPGVADTDSDDPMVRAFRQFDRNQQSVRNCDAVIACLNDYYGWEPESDTSFECGLAFQLGKKLYGYMDDAGHMNKRVPNEEQDGVYRDPCGCTVENFDYPVNLMFSSSMPIYGGTFAQVIGKIAADLCKK